MSAPEASRGRLEVAEARTDEARERVYAFRYRVYVDEMGVATPEADARARILRDPLDAHARSWALWRDGTPVGALRIAYLDELPAGAAAPLVERFAMEDALAAFGARAVCATSRFMLDPALRRGVAILRLLRAVYEDARAHGVRLNYGDCSPHLLPFYEQLGFRRCGPAFMDPHYGFKVPLLMLTGDREHLERVRSPLSRPAADHPDDPEARTWLARRHPESLEARTASLLPEGVFLDLLWDRVAHDPLHALGILRGLERHEADAFLAKATLIRACPGDALVRQGERGDTLFVLLSGGAEVLREEAPDAPLDWLGPGDVFGEMGFLTDSERTAHVVARAETEAVVLSGDFLRAFLAREPAVAAKVLFNLSRTLAERLADMNRRLASG